MIIWTTAGLFSLVENANPYYVDIEARDEREMELLKNTLRLIDMQDEIIEEGPRTHGYFITLLKDDARDWVKFEMDHWISKNLGRQFEELGDIRSATALEKLLINLEK